MIKYNLTKQLDSTVFNSLFGSSIEKNLKSLILNGDTGAKSRKENRKNINSAIERVNIKQLREISKFFYTTNTMYLRFNEYFANMLCFYWMVTPKIISLKELNKDDVIERWWEVLKYIETINPEAIGSYIARKVLLEGACYVAVKEKTTAKSAFGIQYLPIEYCRTRKRYLDRDVIDFNVKYFDEKFSDKIKKQAALETFPSCITDKYFEYHNLKQKTSGAEWKTIDPNYSFRFTLRQDEVPFFVGVVLDLLDLQDVKDITMFKLEQELSKVLVQQFETNSDGQPIVDLDLLKQFHNDTAKMLKNIPGVDIATTYAKMYAVDLKTDDNESSTKSPTSKIVSNVYDNAGISQKLFNADNAGTLTKSIIIDESLMYSLLKQFIIFLKTRIDVNFKKGKIGKAVEFGITMPEVTYGNQKDMFKLYKEQTSLGYSKFLPAIVLGQRQSDIMSSLFFENDILDLVSLMQAPVSSNNISKEDASKEAEKDKKEVGRPTKDDDEVSEKTIKNKETA